jgi:hypothetical protein
MDFARKDGWRTLALGPDRANVTLLLVGRWGHGIALAGDILSAAAAGDGIAVERADKRRRHADTWLTGCVLRLLGRDDDGDRGVDLIVALERLAWQRSARLLRAGGRAIIAPEDVPTFAGRPRILLPSRGPRSVRWLIPQPHATTPAERLSYVLGAASRELGLSIEAWQAALADHLRPRDRDAGRARFAAGRQAAC